MCFSFLWVTCELPYNNPSRGPWLTISRPTQLDWASPILELLPKINVTCMLKTLQYFLSVIFMYPHRVEFKWTLYKTWIPLWATFHVWERMLILPEINYHMKDWIKYEDRLGCLNEISLSPSKISLHQCLSLSHNFTNLIG